MNLPLALLAGILLFGPRLCGAEIVSRTTVSEAPPRYNASYVEKTGTAMRGGPQLSELSTDNGRTWEHSPMTPDYLEGLPYGFRRETPMAACDPDSGRFIGIAEADPDAGRYSASRRIPPRRGPG